MVIDEARRLIDAGDAEGAKTLLLNAGFIEHHDTVVQAAYYELIPVDEPLRERLDGVLKQIGEGEVPTRAKAAGVVAKEAARAVNKKTHAWIRDPRVTDVLIEAMETGQAKLVNQAAGAAILIVSRYFADQRLREPFKKLVKNRNKTVRRHAANALAALYVPENVPLLIGMLQDKADEVRAQVALLMGSLAEAGRLTAAQREEVVPILCSFLRDETYEVRNRAAGALRKCGDPSALDALREAHATESLALVRETLEFAIEGLADK
ncbi:HEAT repeat domain-containing protein [Acanthopleuribacter pedis]|uniref:HEAT repeat domain-containing protein n=1 Tax=Acanthopleuribacter pedis TaxID=442870 RepID=A0A8J7U5Y3_9BACT|nr:HEAT repeat domain-containing protein [Acanthopleuribacter pedis]MBO1322202.1 HEAT repeat domain-containing protein [Acanthopleuribacter pedis]